MCCSSSLITAKVAVHAIHVSASGVRSFNIRSARFSPMQLEAGLSSTGMAAIMPSIASRCFIAVLYGEKAIEVADRFAVKKVNCMCTNEGEDEVSVSLSTL